MRNGAIICIAGQAPTMWTDKDEAEFREKIDTYDKVHIIPVEINSFLLHCAWLDLMSKGMNKVVIKKAVFKKTGELEFTGFSCMLPIISMN